jgi:paraquat-inducible protein B
LFLIADDLWHVRSSAFGGGKGVEKAKAARASADYTHAGHHEGKRRIKKKEERRANDKLSSSSLLLISSIVSLQNHRDSYNTTFYVHTRAGKKIGRKRRAREREIKSRVWCGRRKFNRTQTARIRSMFESKKDCFLSFCLTRVFRGSDVRESGEKGGEEEKKRRKKGRRRTDS